MYEGKATLTLKKNKNSWSSSESVCGAVSSVERILVELRFRTVHRFEPHPLELELGPLRHRATDWSAAAADRISCVWAGVVPSGLLIRKPLPARRVLVARERVQIHIVVGLALERTHRLSLRLPHRRLLPPVTVLAVHLTLRSPTPPRASPASPTTPRTPTPSNPTRTPARH